LQVVARLLVGPSNSEVRMGRVLLPAWLALVSCLVLLGAGAPARAEEKPGSEPKPPSKVRVTTEKDGKEEERTFDLNNPDDLKTVIQLLHNNEVAELKRDKPPDIFGLRWDLGVWTLVVFLLLLYILRRAAWGPMLEAVRKREEAIRGAHAEAERLRN